MNFKSEPSKIVGIIQARMGSTRLPGKVLAEIRGRPMLWRVVQRTLAAETLDEVIVATTTQSSDDVIVSFCRDNRVGCFRGGEEDVLDRYYRAALQQKADAVVRITSDCPLIDPQIVDRVVRAFLQGDCDYASNCMTRTYPRGLDTEVMTFQALQRAWSEATEPFQRAHVTPYIYQNPTQFKILSVTGERDYSAYRWTVDTPEDLEFVRAVYDRLPDEKFLWDEVLRLMESEPELAEINRRIAQKAIHEG